MQHPVPMSLNEYLTGAGNFHRFDAKLQNGGLITAHHGSDKSTADLYNKMKPGFFLITYKSTNGEFVRLIAVDGTEIVNCILTRN